MPTGHVDSQHPAYVERLPEWQQERDSYKGEKAIKARGVVYLPATSSMEIDGMVSTEQDGYKAYDAYRKRARYPELVSDAVETMLGVMHSKPATIEVPAAMESLLERATLRRESLQALLRRINEEQLVIGRCGLMADVAEGADLPLIALYHAEDVINWDESDDDYELDTLNLVVIDESGNERIRGFDWEHVDKHRVLWLGDLEENEVEGTTGAVYRAAEVRERKGAPTEEETIEPNVRGATLDQVPFIFVNTKDVVAAPEEGPLMSLGNLCLTIYRTEADYRQALFLQGQDTLVKIGPTGESEDDGPTRTGTGAEIHILDPNGDAKYIGVDSGGLPELRQALENDYERGESRAQGLVDAVSRAAESGEALRVRVAARTASLNQIALTGAFALEEILKIIAKWIGANPDEVMVTPNLDFVGDILKGQELVAIQTAKELGAPLSQRTIHDHARNRGLTEKTFEDELKEMEQEYTDGVPGSVMMGEDRRTSQSAVIDGLGEDDDPEEQPGQGASGDDTNTNDGNNE